MAKDEKGSAIIPALLGAAAVYFGLNKNSGELGDLAKQAVSRVVDDQAPKQRTTHRFARKVKRKKQPTGKRNNENRNQ